MCSVKRGLNPSRISTCWETWDNQAGNILFKDPTDGFYCVTLSLASVKSGLIETTSILPSFLPCVHNIVFVRVFYSLPCMCLLAFCIVRLGTLCICYPWCAVCEPISSCCPARCIACALILHFSNSYPLFYARAGEGNRRGRWRLV